MKIASFKWELGSTQVFHQVFEQIYVKIPVWRLFSINLNLLNHVTDACMMVIFQSFLQHTNWLIDCINSFYYRSSCCRHYNVLKPFCYMYMVTNDVTSMFIFRSLCGGNCQYCDASLLRGWGNSQQRSQNDVLQYRYFCKRQSIIRLYPSLHLPDTYHFNLF